MSYAQSLALQKAVFARLSADAGVQALVPGRVFDAPPAGPVPELYLTLGPERVRDRSDATGPGAIHDLTLSVIGGAQGFAPAKAVAGATCDALVGAAGGAGALPALERGRLVSLRFLRAVAKRDSRGDRRRIDLTFRARVDE